MMSNDIRQRRVDIFFESRTMTDDDFFSALKRLRETRSMTQKDLAKRAGISVVMVSRYETATAKPSPRTTSKLRTVLGVDGGGSHPTPSAQNLEPHDGIRHIFHLRAGETVSLDLPPDLTQGEADRLAGFVKSLPFQ